ncbi:LAGLIDADG family homing endonuclease [Ectobacillus funiculus]
MFKVDANTVANIVRRHGFTLRQGGYIPALKFTDFFRTIDTEEKAYYLGMMITDGCVVIQESRSPCIGIMLKKEDKYIIDRFAEILGFESDRVKISNRDEIYFRFHSKEMADDLAKFGVTPTKTFTTYIPTITEHVMPHLIRGCFDGDGSVFVHTTKEGRNSLRVAFYGTHLACEQFQGHLINTLNISKTKVYKQKSHNVSFININRKKDILAFYNYIYKDAKIYLNRKKEEFDNNMDLLEYCNKKTKG